MEDTERIIITAFIVGLLLGLLAVGLVHADEPRYKIAILDTGYDPARATGNPILCKEGHYDFLTNTRNVNFVHPHGTRIASIIAEKLKGVDYCLVIFQIFTGADVTAIPNGAVKQSLDDLGGLRVSAANMSFGGELESKEEQEGIKNAIKGNAAIFIAAGNLHHDLDKKCDYFPVCYKVPGMVVVGAQDLTNPKKHADISNYGKVVDVWAPGYWKNLDDPADDDFGTSYAAPRALSEYILFLEHKRLKK